MASKQEANGEAVRSQQFRTEARSAVGTPWTRRAKEGALSFLAQMPLVSFSSEDLELLHRRPA